MTEKHSADIKKEVRERFKSHRMSLGRAEILEKSSLICQKLLNLREFKNSKLVHCYSPIDEANEVDTTNILNYVIGSSKQLLLPKIVKDGQLSHHSVDSLTDLKINKWGVAEPITTVEADVSKIDLVIVPMVAGDFDRNRLGYGKGFYDRFLSKTDAITVGLLFEIQLSKETLPTESFDIKLDKLITEERII